MGKERPERVQEALRQEISKIVTGEVKDPRLGFITITRVELTRDLRFAKVFFTVLEEEKQARTLKGLVSAKGYIRNLIGERIKLQFVPEIQFKLDETVAYTKHVYDVLEKLAEERKKRERENPAEDGES